MRNQNAKIALLTSLMMSSLVGYAQQNETVIKNGNGDKEVKVIVKTDKPQKMKIEKRVTVTDKGETIVKVDTIMEDAPLVIQGGGTEKRIIIKGKGDKVEGIEEGNPNKEMKIVIKGDKKDGKEDKEIVIYKKYVVKDSADMEATMKQIQIEEEAAGTPAGAKRKEIIVIDGESIEKGMEGIGEEIEGIVEEIGEEVEKNVQVFVDDSGKQKIIRIETENENDGDTTEVKLKGRKVIIIKDNDGTHVSVKKKGSEGHGDSEGDEEEDKECCEKRKAVDVEPFALDLGLNNYLTDGKLAKISDPRLQLNAWRSVDVNCYFAPTRVALTNNGKVNLKTAISLNMNNLMFNNDSSYLTKNPVDYLSFTKVDQPLQKNKLLATYVQLPLLLNFQTNPGKDSKNVSFSIGGYAGYLLGSRAKHIKADGDKVRENGNYNLNPIKYGLTARLDFRWFDFYVNYNLSSLFEDKKGPTTQLVSAGINLLDF